MNRHGDPSAGSAALVVVALVLLVGLVWASWVAVRDENVALAVLIGAFLIFAGMVRLRG